MCDIKEYLFSALLHNGSIKNNEKSKERVKSVNSLRNEQIHVGQDIGTSKTHHKSCCNNVVADMQDKCEQITQSTMLSNSKTKIRSQTNQSEPQLKRY